VPDPVRLREPALLPLTAPIEVVPEKVELSVVDPMLRVPAPEMLPKVFDPDETSKKEEEATVTLPVEARAPVRERVPAEMIVPPV
jgi:hypothetical protein